LLNNNLDQEVVFLPLIFRTFLINLALFIYLASNSLGKWDVFTLIQTLELSVVFIFGENFVNLTSLEMLNRVHKANWQVFTIISYHTYLSFDSVCGFLEVNVLQKMMLVFVFLGTFFNFFDLLESYFLTWWRSIEKFLGFIRTW
jgi:hypothetical protein